MNKKCCLPYQETKDLVTKATTATPTRSLEEILTETNRMPSINTSATAPLPKVHLQGTQDGKEQNIGF